MYIKIQYTITEHEIMIIHDYQNLQCVGRALSETCTSQVYILNLHQQINKNIL